MIVYLMSPGADVDAVLSSSGFFIDNRAMPGAESQKMPELFTRAFDLSAPESIEQNLQIATAEVLYADPSLDITPAIIERLNAVQSLDVRLVPVRNAFFGGSVTCAGLLTGTDILQTLESEADTLGDEILIPSICLKDDEDVFLDWHAHRDFARLADRLLLPRQALHCESVVHFRAHVIESPKSTQ